MVMKLKTETKTKVDISGITKLQTPANVALVTPGWNELKAVTDIRGSFLAEDEDKIATGLFLLEAKQNVPHGKFKEWCGMYFPERTYDTCTRRMNSALSADINDTTSFLSAERQALIEMQEKQKLLGVNAAGITKRGIERQEKKIEKIESKIAAKIAPRDLTPVLPPAKVELPDPAIAKAAAKAAKAKAKLEEEAKLAAAEKLKAELNAKIKVEADAKARELAAVRKLEELAELQRKVLADEPALKARLTEEAKAEWREELGKKAEEASPGLFSKLDNLIKHRIISIEGGILETIKEILLDKDPTARDLLKKLLNSMFHPDNGRVRKDGDLLARINDEFTRLEMRK